MGLHKIGLLDFGTRSTEYFNSDMSVRVIREAILAEKLGFSRVWYAEHYGAMFNNWLSADVIVSLVAAYTNTINVGVAGALIQYAHPLKLAADYKLLSSTFSERIDLGFAKGSAAGKYAELFNFMQLPFESDPNVMIREKIKMVIKLINDEENNLADYILLPPLKGSKPKLWNLAGSPKGYLQSLELGINCSRTLVHPGTNSDPGLEILAQYKETFFDKFGRYPLVNVMAAGTCQKDHRLAKNVIKALNKRNIYGINLDKAIYGCKNEVFDKLCKCAETYGVDEIIFLDVGFNDKQRRASFRNISEAFKFNAVTLS